jgi:hypothetical protein
MGISYLEICPDNLLVMNAFLINYYFPRLLDAVKAVIGRPSLPLTSVGL